MSLDYPNRSDWLAKRATPRVVRTERVAWSKGTYRRRRPGPTHVSKGLLRADKKMRMEAMYRSFFADPNMIERIDDHGLMHLIEDQRRLVRDVVLGSLHPGG